jgi:hypothetical protein
LGYDSLMAEGEENATPHQGIRIPRLMWDAFGRVCTRRGETSRNDRLRDLITADIRRYGDEQDRADLGAALADLKAKRSRKGPRGRRRTSSSLPGDSTGDETS